ncbi:MAG TPA: hypothetical protein VMM36_12860 [Opitutaceae bacterium]|nr:hypothetical protein [Opitutaceae bacterium]
MRFLLPVTLSFLLAASLAAQQAVETATPPARTAEPSAELSTQPQPATPSAVDSETPAALAAQPAAPEVASTDPLVASTAESGDFQPGSLRGRIENGRYYAPTDAFDIAIPMLVGDRPLVLDNPNIVVFRDDVRTMLTIAAIRMEAIDKWDLETTSPREFLIKFFRESVLADYRESFPGTTVESARLLNNLEGGALLVATLHPNGSAFETDPIVRNDPATPPPVAKRGNLIFARGDFVYVISTELADRVTESSTYTTDIETEDRILNDRLVEVHSKIHFAGDPAPETLAN